MQFGYELVKPDMLMIVAEDPGSSSVTQGSAISYIDERAEAVAGDSSSSRGSSPRTRDSVAEILHWITRTSRED